MTSFSSLPLDILLVVFRELDVVGSVRLGMVSCLSIYQSPLDRNIPSQPPLRDGTDM